MQRTIDLQPFDKESKKESDAIQIETNLDIAKVNAKSSSMNREKKTNK